MSERGRIARTMGLPRGPGNAWFVGVTSCHELGCVCTFVCIDERNKHARVGSADAEKDTSTPLTTVSPSGTLVEPSQNPHSTLPQSRPGPPQTLSGLRPHRIQLLGKMFGTAVLIIVRDHLKTRCGFVSLKDLPASSTKGKLFVQTARAFAPTQLSSGVVQSSCGLEGYGGLGVNDWDAIHPGIFCVCVHERCCFDVINVLFVLRSFSFSLFLFLEGGSGGGGAVFV